MKDVSRLLAARLFSHGGYTEVAARQYVRHLMQQYRDYVGRKRHRDSPAVTQRKAEMCATTIVATIVWDADLMRGIPDELLAMKRRAQRAARRKKK